MSFRLDLTVRFPRRFGILWNSILGPFFASFLDIIWIILLDQCLANAYTTIRQFLISFRGGENDRMGLIKLWLMSMSSQAFLGGPGALGTPKETHSMNSNQWEAAIRAFFDNISFVRA
jgi:hypothetical protein